MLQPKIRQLKHHRQQKNSKKLFVLVFILTLSWLFYGIPLARAESEGVNMSAQVLPRKLTDTINDFDFSKINPLGSPSAPKLVKGAATSRDSSPNILTKFFNRVVILIRNIF